MTEANTPPQEMQSGDESKREVFVDLLQDNFRFLLGLAVAYVIAGHAGYAPFPTIQLWHYMLVSALVIGRYGIASIIYSRYGDDFGPEVRTIRLESKTGVSGIINIPKRTFADFDIIGSLPTTRTITGERQWRARAVDMANKVIVAAGTAPDDDRYPDDHEIIAEEGDLLGVEALERALLEDAQEGRKNRVSDEVRAEMAMQDVSKQIAKAMKEVRDSQGEIGDDEIEQRADETSGDIVQLFAESGGDDDE